MFCNLYSSIAIKAAGMEAGSILLTSLKAGASAVSLAGASHLVRRLAPVQRVRMREKLAAIGSAVTAPASMGLPRPEISTVSKILARTPTSPIVLIGPEGAGTSSIAKAALAMSRPTLLLHINLRELAATGERSLPEQIVYTCGYYTSPREFADLGLLSRGGTRRVDDYDVEECFARLTEVLRSEKQRASTQAFWSRWTRGLSGAPAAPPTFVIDELHVLHNERERTAMARFLRFAMFLTDEALAHVVFITRPWGAHELDGLQVGDLIISQHSHHLL